MSLIATGVVYVFYGIVVIKEGCNDVDDNLHQNKMYTPEWIIH